VEVFHSPGSADAQLHGTAASVLNGRCSYISKCSCLKEGKEKKKRTHNEGYYFSL